MSSQDERGYLTIERWKLTDVAEGRVTPEAMLTYFAVQAHGSPGRACWPGNERLARTRRCSQSTVKRDLAALVAAGWVQWEFRSKRPEERKEGEDDPRPRRFLTCLRERGAHAVHPQLAPCAPSAPHAPGAPGELGGGAPHAPRGGAPGELRNNHQGSTSSEVPPLPPRSAGGERGSSKPEGKKKPKAKASGPPGWAMSFAVELVQAYPHGPSRRKGPTEVARALLKSPLAALQGEDRDQLMARIRAAVAQEAQARPPGSEGRSYSPMLTTWLNNARWEAPAERVNGSTGGTPLRGAGAGGSGWKSEIGDVNEILRARAGKRGGEPTLAGALLGNRLREQANTTEEAS